MLYNGIIGKKRVVVTCALGLLTLPLLSSCQSAIAPDKHGHARVIASRGHLNESRIEALPFTLTSFQRLEQSGAPINIYIEGDGQAWLSKTQPALNPTPKQPVALELAARDPARNVVYLARPCQYSGMSDGSPCPNKYWMGSRYAPDVLRAYNQALDALKARSGANGFNLIGFSGGGTVAALLAGQRDDVISLRSVAGNLDHRAHSDIHKVSTLDASLNPPQYAAKLATIPQRHFIGGKDKIVPKTIYERYSAALPNGNCISYEILPQADHLSGWVENWQSLLAQPLACR